MFHSLLEIDFNFLKVLHFTACGVGLQNGLASDIIEKHRYIELGMRMLSQCAIPKLEH